MPGETYTYNDKTGYYELSGGGTNTYSDGKGGTVTVGNGTVVKTPRSGGGGGGGGSNNRITTPGGTTDWAKEYANNDIYNKLVTQYGAENVHNAFDYMNKGGTDKNELKNIIGGGAGGKTVGELSKMKFGKDVYNSGGSYDINKRNADIANLMKQSGIKATDATSVRDFLEKYSPQSYYESSDEDKNKTANDIYKLYSGNIENETPITNDDTILEEGNEEYHDYDENGLNELLGEAGWLDEENNTEEQSELEKLREENKKLQEDNKNWQDKWLDNQNNYIDTLQQSIQSLFGNNEEEKKTGLTDEQKEANAAASSAAWNSAQGGNKVSEEQPINAEEANKGLVDTSGFASRNTKIFNDIKSLGYSLDNIPTERGKEEAISNAIEGGEPVEDVDKQVEIAEANESKGEITPEFSDENSLINSYETAFAKIAEEGSTPENMEKALKTYLQAKDAASYYVIHNKLSNQVYQDMLKKIKASPSLKTLLENYNGLGKK